MNNFFIGLHNVGLSNCEENKFELYMFTSLIVSLLQIYSPNLQTYFWSVDHLKEKCKSVYVIYLIYNYLDFEN